MNKLETVVLKKFKVASMGKIDGQLIKDVQFNIIEMETEAMIMRLVSYVLSETLDTQERKITVPATAWDSFKMHIRDKYPRLFKNLKVEMTRHTFKYEYRVLYPQLPMVMDDVGAQTHKITFHEDTLTKNKKINPEYYEGKLDALTDEIDRVRCDYSIEFPRHYKESKWI